MSNEANADSVASVEAPAVEGFPMVKPFPPLTFDFWLRSDEPEAIKGFLDSHENLRDLADQVMIFAQQSLSEPRAFVVALKDLCDGWQSPKAPDLKTLEGVADQAGGKRLGRAFDQTLIAARLYGERRLAERLRRCKVIDIQRRHDQTTIPPLSGQARGFFSRVKELLSKAVTPQDRDAVVMFWNDIDHQKFVAELTAYDDRVHARIGGVMTTDYIRHARDVFIPTYTALGHADPKEYFDKGDLRSLNTILLFIADLGVMLSIANS